MAGKQECSWESLAEWADPVKSVCIASHARAILVLSAELLITCAI